VLVIAHMSRDDKPSKIFNKPFDFKQEEYDISKTGAFFRMGGWDASGVPVAKKVAASVFNGWCLEGILTG